MQNIPITEINKVIREYQGWTDIPWDCMRTTPAEAIKSKIYCLSNEQYFCGWVPNYVEGESALHNLQVVIKELTLTQSSTYTAWILLLAGFDKEIEMLDDNNVLTKDFIAMCNALRDADAKIRSLALYNTLACTPFPKL